ncbi:biotin carboxylase N-terminal domain-containing protein [Gryllotalpicola daejeonensis]
MFDSVLVANRGEIACRIIRTLRSLGVRSVAVYSDADADARHVREADAAVRLGPARASESYLSVEKIVAAAISQGAQAIHPGYGFLAENPDLARACAGAGLVFVGPGVRALEVMGDKIRAKQQVAARGVPTVPGIAEPGLSDARLAEAAREIGFPLLIKPSAGGGGKGMHLVTGEGELADALAAARREAASSFGDDTLFLERFVTTPRHIEVQVLADAHGTTVHLGERECSLQRRHQKVIEEAPSALLDAATRERIGAAAVETARSVGYVGAGTVEFIVSADAPDEFFFMEMNTRLQVEHPVTELVAVVKNGGLDLVEWQLRIAAGEALDFSQSDVRLRGHAVEARVYAEDPQHGFLPTGGRVLELVEPAGEGVRVDSSLVAGGTVSSDYDPMLAKVIAWAPDREGALRRLYGALGEVVTLGVDNNVEFLRLLLADADVQAGRLETGLIERRLDGMAFQAADDRGLTAAALILDALEAGAPGAAGRSWARHDGWRPSGQPAPRRFELDAGGSAATVLVRGDGTVSIGEGAPVQASLELDGAHAHARIDGVTSHFVYARDGGRLLLAHEGAAWAVRERQAGAAADAPGAASPELRAPMPGAVTVVAAADGERVAEGAAVVIVEAMKMEHVVRAPRAGTVRVDVAVGEQVAAGQVLAVVEADGDAGEEGGR